MHGTRPKFKVSSVTSRRLLAVTTALTLSVIAFAVALPPEAPSASDANASLWPTRSLDGTGNHPDDIGAAGSAFRRMSQSRTETARSRPDPRVISETLHAYPEGVWTQPDPRNRSLLFAAFGQFLSHDISLRAKSRRPEFVSVGHDDSMFPAGAILPFAPNAPHPETGEPYNRVTSWIDGSMIYGSDPCRAAALRRFDGGELRMGRADHLPRYGENLEGARSEEPLSGFDGCPDRFENENPRRDPATEFFVAGDTRANENPVLLSLHTIFAREHNRRARRLSAIHPEWDDELLYNEARRWVGALVQAVTYYEYLPTLLGESPLPAYEGYSPSQAADVSLEFAAGAFRFGHSQMGPTLFRAAPNGERFKFSDVSLKACYFATPVYEQAGGGPGTWLTGASQFRAEPVDLAIIDDLRNYMFGDLNGGLDVATINIAVGRDSALGTFNDIRASVGLPPKHTFNNLSSDTQVVEKLSRLYGAVEHVDPWVAMLAEARASGDRSVDGETLRAVIAEQFSRLRDGDRFYFENDPALGERSTLP
ncbi:MAG: peroxidase family protein [Myxococcota bacterium]